jgi:outer membrane protein insertion porin family
MVAVTRALSLWGVRLPLSVFVCLLIAAVVAPAQETGVDFEGRIIGRIDFDPPNQPLPRPELDQLLTFHPGDPLQHAEVRAAIEKLYQTGRFSDISVDVAPDQDKVAVQISTQLSYFVSGVTIDGVPEPPNQGQLLTAAKLELGAKFADNDLTQASENIMDRLRANGLYQAKIQASVERVPDTEEANILFQVDSGDRARFDGVQLSGTFTKRPEDIIGDTRWRRGLGPITLPGWREVTERRIQTGVSRVLQDLQRGDHLAARVTLDRLDYHDAANTVTPTLTIDSGPALQVNIVGAKVSKGKLRQLIPIYPERTVDRSLLMEGTRNLVEYFQSQGYFDAQVALGDIDSGNNREEIDYEVTPGVRHKLVNLEIKGNHFFDTETLRERLFIMPATFLRSRYGRYSQRLLERDQDAIRDLYHSNGFRDVQVTARTEDDYKGQMGQLSVQLDIQEGTQWLVGKLDFEGVSDTDAAYLRPMLQSTAGQPFSEANVAADRDAILNYYYSNGYSDATFDWTQTPADTPTTLDIRYIIHPGRHEFVRRVLVRGLQTTRPGLVENRILLSPGDPISQSRIAESQQKLYDLGIFSKVETAIQNPQGDEDRKYVMFRMEEANRYSLNVGIGAQLGRIGSGVTTFDEPAGAPGFSPRVSLGLSRLNFLGLAHTVSLQTRFSTIDQRAVLSYLVPQFSGHENLAVTVSGLFDDSRDIRTFAARRWEGSVQLAQRISRANSMQYRFNFRRVTISDLVISPNLLPLLATPERVGQFSMSFIQDRRDDPVNSHRGIYNTVDAGVALRQFGSETVFTRLLFRNSTYYSLSRNVVLARTLQFGYIQRFAGLSQIPLAERFFAGGASSNRAFPDNQAGPRDPFTGFPLGGNALLFHSTELRFPLIGDNLGGVLFHDMGNVYSELRDINFRFRQRNLQDFDYMVHSVGFGIRYRTPIGPLRADFGLSPNSPRFVGFQGTREDLVACGDSCPTVNQRINIFQFHFSLGQTF